LTRHWRKPLREPLREPLQDRGFVTIEYVVAAALSMVVLVAMANFIVFEYGHGVVRTALDQGVRAGARAGSPVTMCRQAAQRVVDDLLGGSGGSMGGGVSITCRQVGANLDATAQTRFRAWMPPIPDWSFTSSATAPVERAP
jgi:hypothetical protein